MPTIQQVADQINTKLDQINNNTAATVAVGNGIRNDLAQVNTKLTTLDAHLQTGFSVLSNGLFAIWELQKVTNSILDHHTKQNNTIICLLENTNDLLCGITRKVTRQLDLTEQLVRSVMRVEGIEARVEPAAAADFDRNAELQKEIRECCPPDEVPPEPCPEPCEVSQPKPHEPIGQDWHPLPPPRQPVN